MSVILRSANLRAARVAPSAIRQQARGVHFENKVGSTLPFSHKNRYIFGASLVAYASLGFFLPFGAAAWHIKKSSGSA